MRAFRKALLIIAALLGVGLLSLAMLARVYEGKVKEVLIAALNRQLNAPVSVSGVDLTLLARFPKASLRLHNVLVNEVRTDDIPADTLLAADELYLEFSIWGLIRGDYTIQRIHGKEVDLRPGIDRNGVYTHLIWKSDTTSSSTAIALESVSVNALRLRFRDARNALQVDATSKSLVLSGTFGEALNSVDLAGDLLLLRWAQGRDVVLEDRQADLRMAMTFGGPDESFRITRGELVTGRVPLEVTLELLPGAKGDHLDLRANGLGLDLARVLALLPKDLLPGLDRYDIRGEVDLALQYAGHLDGPGPALSVGAKVNHGKLKELRTGTTFSQVGGELALELSPSGIPRRIRVNGLTARSGSGTLRGNWSSEGLQNAPVKADLEVDLALADLLGMARVDTLEQVAGRIQAELHAEGRLRDVGDIKAQDLRGLRIGGTVSLADASMKIKGLRYRAEDLDAALALEGNDAVVQNLSLSLQGDRMQLNGRLINLMPFLFFDDQLLTIQADGRAERMDLAALLRDDEAPRNSEKGYTLTLPGTIALDVKARVEELRFEEFRATALSGTIRMRDKVLKVSPVTFNTAQGAVLGRLELDGRGSGPYPMAIDANVQDIDLKELFRQLQDLGQDFIGHRHLSGRAQAKITLTAPLSPALSLDLDRLVCTVDIAVDQGGIKGHAPLIAVADHLRSNKMVAPFVNIPALRERLSDVRFARLENRIDIRNGAVHIPTMEVKSNALDLELSGVHYFDDRIDHHLSFRLGDLFRIGKPTRDEFGPIIDDGTGLRVFLHMYGTASDPQFANDGAMAAARRKQQFQQERQELKSVLREGFGIGKRSEEPQRRSDPAQPRIQLEWEDGPATSPQDGPNRARRERPRRDDDPARERIVVEDP